MYTASVSGIILRPNLIEKMQKIQNRAHIFITAPGGYGKTVAAHQWLSYVNGATVKLYLTADDNDPVVFYKRLAYALLKVTGKEKRLADAPVSANDFLKTVNLLPNKHKRCYLLLDDVHNIENPDIVRFLPIIAARLPKYIRLCIAGRCEPTDALLQTGLFEILMQDDLVFSAEEVEWLCAEKDRALTSKQISDLLKATGGWAIYVSAILTGEGDLKKPYALTQYFENRVWSLWNKDFQKLLLSLCVPSQVTPLLYERLTGGSGGAAFLKRLIREKNVFLSQIAGDTYRFHDIFRDFVMKHSELLGFEEIRRLNDIAAEWYYEQGDYYASMRHYISNADHNGIELCMNEINRFQTGTMSIETRTNFTNRYILSLPDDFIANSPLLISKCAAAAHSSANAEMFARYADMLYLKLPEIAAKQPDLLETIGFSIGIDYRMTFREYVKRVTQMLPLMAKAAVSGNNARINSITQNLPFYHRSMRDFSEYHELKPDDFAMIKAAFGVIIGRDYAVQEQAVYAGLLFERGELLEALRHAINGYHILCGEDMSPETVFCSHMILCSVLDAMGAKADAGKIMERTESFVKEHAQFLQTNLKALQTKRSILTGELSAAREWLDIYAFEGSHLPFYLICQHFTTLRSHIALKEFSQAVDFGKRLQILSVSYNRPLDQIESGILTAAALWKNGKKQESTEQMSRSVKLAMPYDFTQLFVNEGEDILPILLTLRSEKSGGEARFADRLCAGICGHQTDKPDVIPIALSPMRRKMLGFLERGLTYNEIAGETGLKHGSVKTHVLLLYKQLGVHNAKDAVAKAKISGLME